MAETTKSQKLSSYETAVMASREAYRQSIVQKRYDKFFPDEETKTKCPDRSMEQILE